MSDVGQGSKPPSTRRGQCLDAFLSLGFRPFFLGAALFALAAIGLWMLALRTDAPIMPVYGVAMWHMHEMLFGYGPAVLSGFLLTAVPNWTGRKPLTGARLGALFVLWLAGRVAMIAPVSVPVMVALDTAFLPIVALIVLREIVAAKNWRNLMVLGPIVLFALANGVFHAEAAFRGTSEYGTRLGLAALLFLVMLIGGRIVPAFTRNWLVSRGSKRRPVKFGRFDGISLLSTAAALSLWVLVPVDVVTATGLGLVSVLHGVRMSRWAGLATFSEPLLFVLHGAYAMIPAGLALLALGAGTGDEATRIAALHLLGIGAIGAMTMSVMIRASLGHTGRALKADGWIRAALGFIFASAGLRMIAAFVTEQSLWVDLSAGFWMAGFGLFVLRIGPSLLQANPGSPP